MKNMLFQICGLIVVAIIAFKLGANSGSPPPPKESQKQAADRPSPSESIKQTKVADSSTQTGLHSATNTPKKLNAKSLRKTALTGNSREIVENRTKLSRDLEKTLYWTKLRLDSTHDPSINHNNNKYLSFEAGTLTLLQLIDEASKKAPSKVRKQVVKFYIGALPSTENWLLRRQIIKNLTPFSGMLSPRQKQILARFNHPEMHHFASMSDEELIETVLFSNGENQ